MSKVARFHQHLESLGIPIEGVSGDGPGARIDFAETVTDEQRAAGLAARDTFRWELTPEEEQDVEAERNFGRHLVAFARALKEQFPQLDLDTLRDDFKRFHRDT